MGAEQPGHRAGRFNRCTARDDRPVHPVRRPDRVLSEDIPPAVLYVSVEAPVGTSAEVTNEYAIRLKAEVERINGISDAETIVTTVGATGGGGPMEGSGPSGPEAARITLSMVDYQERRFDVFETLATMQERIGTGVAGAEVRVDQVTEGMPTGPPVNIEIAGEDPVLLQELASEAIDLIEASPVYPRLVGLKSDMDDARPELRVEVDREKASLYGLSTNDVGFLVRSAINGSRSGEVPDRQRGVRHCRAAARGGPEGADPARRPDGVHGRAADPAAVGRGLDCRRGVQFDPPQGHGQDGHRQRRGGCRLQQQRGAHRGRNGSRGLRRGAPGRLFPRIHRRAGGAGGGLRLPRLRLPRRADADRPDPGDPVQFHRQAGDHSVLGHHVHDRRADRIDGFPDAVRNHHDRGRSHLAGRHRCEQRHCPDRLHRGAAQA